MDFLELCCAALVIVTRSVAARPGEAAVGGVHRVRRAGRGWAVSARNPILSVKLTLEEALDARSGEVV